MNAIHGMAGHPAQPAIAAVAVAAAIAVIAVMAAFAINHLVIRPAAKQTAAKTAISRLRVSRRSRSDVVEALTLLFGDALPGSAGRDTRLRGPVRTTRERHALPLARLPSACGGVAARLFYSPRPLRLARPWSGRTAAISSEAPFRLELRRALGLQRGF